MFSLENELLQIAGVKEVLRHKLTATKGRWSIMTSDSAFKYVTETLKRNIQESVAIYSQKFPMDKSLPAVRLAFKGAEQDDDSSGGSFNSYLSSCSTVFSDQNTDFSAPPVPNSPAIQAWGPVQPNIPREIQSTATTQVVSGISSSNYTEVDREKEQMTREIRELKAQVQKLLQKPTERTPVSTPTVDMSSIMAEVRKEVQKAMQLNQPKQSTINEAPTAGNDANISGGDINMSVDSKE
jgi:hypothetical protein